jgi:hypothetical protein
MHNFITHQISKDADAIAPDGSEVRILAATARGSMAQFSLPAGKISLAVVHRTVEEVWFFTSGQGQMMRPRRLFKSTPAFQYQFQSAPIFNSEMMETNRSQQSAPPCHRGRAWMRLTP